VTDISKGKGVIKMREQVSAVFSSHHDAVEAARRVKDAGLRTSDISVIANEDVARSPDSVSTGAISGTALGGAAGLLLGLGTVAIPGLGVVAAAGPIAGLLSGAVTGGVVGAMVDLGIPAERSEEYSRDIKSGKTVWAMEVDREKADSVREILKDCGAIKI